MTDFALFRTPNETFATRFIQTSGRAEAVGRYTLLNHAEGFVFAPFTISKDCPILVIRPDVVERVELTTRGVLPQQSVASSCSTAVPVTPGYHRDFQLFHQQLLDGRFDKIVLSRSEDFSLQARTNAEEMFRLACAAYPQQFVALVSTRCAGTWLMATPEVLLKGGSAQWKTMALAGTMKLKKKEALPDDEVGLSMSLPVVWSAKNKEEQQLVARYIRACLQQLASHINESEPYTQQAGELVHLRTDFTFIGKEGYGLGDIVDALHPTPAVCGLPKQEAWAYICANESHERRYYSGFCGTVSKGGNAELYVSLRCMQVEENRCRLYAGGGLLKDSSEEQEWEETTVKMETMRRVMMSAVN